MERFFATILAAAVIAAGCREKPPVPAEPEPPSLKPSVDEQMAEALKLVDPDLIYKRVPLPEEENAFTLWAQAMEKLVPIEGAEEHARRLKRYREEHGDKLAELYGREFKPDPGQLSYSAEHSWDMEPTDLEKTFRGVLFGTDEAPAGEVGRRFTEWLERNRGTFDLIDAGIARSRLQLPVPKHTVPDFYFPSTVQYIALMRAAKARVLAWADDFDAAARELLAAQRMGELLAEGEGGNEGHGSISTILSLCARDLVWLSGRATVPGRTLERIVSELRPFDNLADAVAQDMRIHFLRFHVYGVKDTLAKLAAVDEQTRLQGVVDLCPGLKLPDAVAESVLRYCMDRHIAFLDPSATLQTASRQLAAIIENVKRPWKDCNWEINRELMRRRKEWTEQCKTAERIFREVSEAGRELSADEMKKLAEVLQNAVGKAIFAVGPYVGPSPVVTCCGFRANREGTRAVVALRLYEIRHGDLPATLAELVTDGILKAVPRDVFSDGGLLYSRERRVVWSVGDDGKDDGGDPGDADRSPAGRKDMVWRVPVPE